VVDTRSADWREEVRAASQGRPVDVVFDPVGGNATDPAFRSLGYNGRHLVIGFTGGITALKTNLPLVKTASLIGVQLRTFGEHEPAKAAANMDKCLELAAQGLLKPMIGRVFRFDEFREAMNAAFIGERAGRVVMKVD
jgi:NADPH2:quinone reductase